MSDDSDHSHLGDTIREKIDHSKRLSSRNEAVVLPIKFCGFAAALPTTKTCGGAGKPSFSVCHTSEVPVDEALLEC